MKNLMRRAIGWISRDAMTPAQAADLAIAKTREVCGINAGVLHLDTVTGKLTLIADVDAPIPDNTFVRGVRYDSDPDVLAADLRSEALAARLIAGRQPSAKKPRRPGPAPGTRHTLTIEAQQKRKAAVAALIRKEKPINEICAENKITRSTLYRWCRELQKPETEAA